MGKFDIVSSMTCPDLAEKNNPMSQLSAYQTEYHSSITDPESFWADKSRAIAGGVLEAILSAPQLRLSS